MCVRLPKEPASLLFLATLRRILAAVRIPRLILRSCVEKWPFFGRMTESWCLTVSWCWKMTESWCWKMTVSWCWKMTGIPQVLENDRHPSGLKGWAHNPREPWANNPFFCTKNAFKYIRMVSDCMDSPISPLWNPPGFGKEKSAMLRFRLKAFLSSMNLMIRLCTTVQWLWNSNLCLYIFVGRHSKGFSLTVRESWSSDSCFAGFFCNNSDLRVTNFSGWR